MPYNNELFDSIDYGLIDTSKVIVINMESPDDLEVMKNRKSDLLFALKANEKDIDKTMSKLRRFLKNSIDSNTVLFTQDILIRLQKQIFDLISSYFK